ncbi:autotransporter-associated N-terminal domain-containing protein [Sebaldella sp. S0638]|uniref:autotransporter-associated N-terminal domain-containing protein n=1 Tax=Sebaldella sp. S0638 TaxID=2957809 RepID=UPI0020A16E14|nr:autotransporter-associated N-terminal domain-containing protein [Sebaldella sp. S0638]MCP1225590.1 autotransporter-associated N-terminal domain-containing protein [Sebaldella sp. S0638]
MNILERVEKELKSCLKHNRNIKFSKQLALTFLMTGGFVGANEVPKSTNVTQNVEAKIKKLKADNKKNLNKGRRELKRLELEGDQVIKIPWEPVIKSL